MVRLREKETLGRISVTGNIPGCAICENEVEASAAPGPREGIRSGMQDAGELLSEEI